MAEWTGILFGMETLGDPKNIVLDVGHDLPVGRGLGECSLLYCVL